MVTALQNGLSQAMRNKRMVLVFYLTNLVFGLVLMLPFRGVLADYAGNSMMAEILAGRLDMNFLFEFMQANDSLTGILTSMVPLVPILYWLLLLFLSGGAFAVFASGESYTPAAFWGGAASNFGRFIRLLLWCLPFGLLFFCLQFLVSIVQSVFFGSDAYQNVTYWLGWATVAVRYVSIILFGMLLDYARVHAVSSGERKMRRSVWAAFKFMFANFAKTFALALSLFLIGAVILTIYNLLSNSLSAPSPVVILLMFLLQQLYMVVRMFIRLAFYSSHTSLYQQLAVVDKVPEVAGQDELGVAGAPA